MRWDDKNKHRNTVSNFFVYIARQHWCKSWQKPKYNNRAWFTDGEKLSSYLSSKNLIFFDLLNSAPTHGHLYCWYQLSKTFQNLFYTMVFHFFTIFLFFGLPLNMVLFVVEISCLWLKRVKHCCISVTKKPKSVCNHYYNNVE